MPGCTPFGQLTDLLTLSIELRNPFPVSTFEDHSKVGPGMIMHIIGVAAQKMMQENVEREIVAVSEKQIVAFQVRTIFHTIHHNSLATHTVQKL
jgi:hypothetical protein